MIANFGAHSSGDSAPTDHGMGVVTAEPQFPKIAGPALSLPEKRRLWIIAVTGNL